MWTGQSVCVAATCKHSSLLYTCGVGLVYPFPHPVIISSSVEQRTFHVSSQKKRHSMQAIEMRHKFSFWSEKQQLHHREAKFWKSSLHCQGEKMLFFTSRGVYSVRSQKVKLQTKIQAQINTLIFNSVAEESFRKELAVNKIHKLHANKNKFQVTHTTVTCRRKSS